jgi:hypothetical protein
MSDPTPSEQRAATASLGELLSEVSSDLSTLMRQELELAKAELKQSASRAGKGAGMLGGATYAAAMTVLFLSIALWWALGYLIGLAWSGLVVAVVWGAVAGVLYLAGRAQMKKIQGAPKTVESIKRLPEAVQRNEENR